MCIRLEADDEKFNSRDIEMHFEILNLIPTHILFDTAAKMYKSASFIIKLLIESIQQINNDTLVVNIQFDISLIYLRNSPYRSERPKCIE